MSAKQTNRAVLTTGLIQMGITLFLLILGPIVLSIAFGNPDKPLYIPLTILGCLICIAAIYQGFKGLNTIAKSLFDEDKKGN